MTKQLRTHFTLRSVRHSLQWSVFSTWTSKATKAYKM